MLRFATFSDKHTKTKFFILRTYIKRHIYVTVGFYKSKKKLHKWEVRWGHFVLSVRAISIPNLPSLEHV